MFAFSVFSERHKKKWKIWIWFSCCIFKLDLKWRHILFLFLFSEFFWACRIHKFSKIMWTLAHGYSQKITNGADRPFTIHSLWEQQVHAGGLWDWKWKWISKLKYSFKILLWLSSGWDIVSELNWHLVYNLGFRNEVWIFPTVMAKIAEDFIDWVLKAIIAHTTAHFTDTPLE